MKRYFEFVEGTSSKFWEIWREGQNVYTRYGKIGASGQVTVKDEGSEEKAQKLHDKLVKEKTGKGYLEKTAGGAAPAPAAAAPAPAPAKPAAPAKAAAPEKAAPAPAAPAAKAAVAVPAGTRRFEFTEDGSSKFWEITLNENAHTVRYGKIGTAGQEKTKSFGSVDAAQKDAEKLVAEKTKKGYAEIAGEAAAPPAPPIDGPELEQHLEAIAKDPTAAEKRQVFGDWLQSKGHPWGSLIALNHAIATAPSAAKKAELQKEENTLLQSQGVAILGDLARAGRPTRFSWDYGFIDEAIIGSPTDKLVVVERVQTLFGLPAARQLKKLTLHVQPTKFAPHQDWDTSTDDIVDPWKPLIPVLAKAPKSMKAISFGEPPPDSASGYVAKPDLAAVSKALPELESLEIQCAGSPGGDGLGKFGFSNLRSFEARFASAGPADLQSIQQANLPKLERLSVWLGGFSNCTLDDAISPSDWDEDNEDASRYPESYPASTLEELELYDVESDLGNGEAVVKFCAHDWPKSLKHLALKSHQLSATVLASVLSSPVVKQLETLDLSGGTLDDKDVDVFVQNKAALAHLKELNLARNTLTKAGITKLEAAVPCAKCGKQRDGAAGPEFLFRYVATME